MGTFYVQRMAHARNKALEGPLSSQQQSFYSLGIMCTEAYADCSL